MDLGSDNGDCGGSRPLTRLEAMLAGQSTRSRPPVHLWNPPARDDIGLAIAGDGAWSYRQSPIGRIEMVRLFASVLRREQDGRYFVVTPREKVPVSVADAAFAAVEMETRGSGETRSIVWRTNVDDIIVAGPEHPLRFQPQEPAGGLKPYVMVHDGLEALVTRPLYYDLVELAETAVVDGVEQFGVWSDGLFFAMARAADLVDFL